MRVEPMSHVEMDCSFKYETTGVLVGVDLVSAAQRPSRDSLPNTDDPATAVVVLSSRDHTFFPTAGVSVCAAPLWSKVGGPAPLAYAQSGD